MKNVQIFFLLFAIFFLHKLHAQDGEKQIYEEYKQKVSAAEKISPLGDGLFGDKINGYSGALQFSVVDVDLPGVGPPVRFQRKLDLDEVFRRASRPREGGPGPKSGGQFWDWWLDIPHLHGTFLRARGWESSGVDPTLRCNQAALELAGPRPDSGGHSSNFWGGNFLHVPDQGDVELLHVGAVESAFPQDGRVYRWATENQWAFSCLPKTSNGVPGDAFFARSPDGVMYWFDHFVARNAGRSALNSGRDKVFIMPTRIEDRFGNYVIYSYDAAYPMELISIEAKDGRKISITYKRPYNGLISKVHEVSVGSRKWRYEYLDDPVGQFFSAPLKSVVLPDESRWEYSYWAPSGAVQALTPCVIGGFLHADNFLFTAKHPSGAVGNFTLKYRWNGRVGSPRICHQIDASTFVSRSPSFFASLSVEKKEITGHGINAQVWQWTYPAEVSKYADECFSSACPESKAIAVTQPDGSTVKEIYGIVYGKNEGKLIRSEVSNGNGGVLSTIDYSYSLDSAGQSYRSRFGFSPQSYPDPRSGLIQPMVRNEKKEGEVLYVWYVHKDASGTFSFDTHGRQIRVTKANSLGNVRTDITDYHDDYALWVLGLVRRSINVDSGYVVESETEFDSLSLPLWVKRFGNLQNAFSYWPDGNFKTLTDGNGNITFLGDYYRGIPRIIRHPATSDAPEGATETATVNDNGWITSITDGAGSKTCYDYDPMGRMKTILYPSATQAGVCDTSGWQSVHMAFQTIPHDEYGLPAGHWRMHRYEGNKHVNTYFDALWRPVLEETLDLSDIGGTLSQVVKKYDSSGRLSFQSYPIRGVGNYRDVTQGTRTFYDALDRVTRVEQDSEHGTLVTTTQYLPGLKTLVTNPKGFSTTTSFMAWDQPRYDFPILSEQPEGKVIQIGRHSQFGWPLQLTQRNTSNTLLATRRYVYQDNGLLCKTIEPEIGATVYGYDNAGNLTKSAAGLQGFDDLKACNHAEAWASGRAIDRVYDARNRLTNLNFPGGQGNQIWTYEKDNLPKSITAYNDSNNAAPVITTYTYNSRRLLTGESLSQPGWYTWGVGYAYDSIGNLRWQSYPTGLTVDYAPNALGQPTQAKDSAGQIYVLGAQYYPNGSLKQFTYGNGVVHVMLQNERQLPSRVVNSLHAINFGQNNTNAVLDNANQYDRNGNVTNIWDYARGDGYQYSRWLEYDQLDRLTAAGSASFGGDHWHRMTYDALDNLKSWKLAGVKDYAEYVYDTQNRLSSIRNTAGATVEGLAYGPQGNLQNKNGQGYEFDFGNRLRAVTGKEAYRYDGLGRRVMNWRWPTPSMPSGSLSFSLYTQSGQIVYEEDYHSSPTTAKEHVYLAGSIIATRESKWGVSQEVKYQHTDALGSPVAVTNASGQVIERMDYEPWGAIIGKPNHNGIGYTGHVMDGATGLTYMQQRYYDQSIGRFLSVDPVAANSNSGELFNRYSYAFNNPYLYNDPDGRKGKVGYAVELVTGGMRKGARVTFEQAVKLRQAGQNFLADSHRVARRVERSAHGKSAYRDTVDGGRHPLKDEAGRRTGQRGLPHYQSEGVRGHSFYSAGSVVLGFIAVQAMQTAEAADAAAGVVDLFDPYRIGDAGPENECASSCGVTDAMLLESQKPQGRAPAVPPKAIYEVESKQRERQQGKVGKEGILRGRKYVP